MALVWGDGFMSPGGPEEIALLLAGMDLNGKHVLDIGCGVGGIDAVLVQRHGAALVTGVDVDPALIAKATERAQREGLYEQLQFRQIEPGPLPFADATFDVIRNPWYRELARKEHEQLSVGALHNELVAILGEELAAREAESWRAMTVILDSGELRPTHARGRKPAR